MLKALLGMAMLVGLLPAVHAQVQEFPYKAQVVADETYIRSGGGEAFYPTQALSRDTVVTVRRHDPGGWFMIDPPEGSFSWIPEKYVGQTSSDTGEILESNVVVFVGSTFGDETHVWQRKMLAGEKVSVLGQKEVDTVSGPRRMLKIRPPAREFRWIPGASVIPVGAEQKSQRDRNPYVVPSNIVQQRSQKAAETASSDPPSKYSPSHRLARLKQVREEQRQLKAIDQKFRSMIQSDPAAWDLQKIESEYRQLQDTATHKPVAGQIDLRYPAIRRYQVRKAKIDELNQLTAATEKRDAELLASQFGGTGSMSVAGVSPGVVAGGVSVLPPLSSPVIAGGQVPSIAMDVQPEPTPPAVAESNSSPAGGYIGAGLLQRGVDDKSSYLLTSPAGKVLAHVKADESGGIDLESYVGRSVGLRGSRWFDDKLKSDYIEVSGLEEVRIRQ